MIITQRFTFENNNGSYTIVADEEKEAKEKLREQLGLARLPSGTKMISAKDINLDELTTTELKRILKNESERFARLNSHYEKNKDLGQGWPFILSNIKKDINLLENQIKSNG